MTTLLERPLVLPSRISSFVHHPLRESELHFQIMFLLQKPLSPAEPPKKSLEDRVEDRVKKKGKLSFSSSEKKQGIEKNLTPLLLELQHQQIYFSQIFYQSIASLYQSPLKMSSYVSLPNPLYSSSDSYALHTFTLAKDAWFSYFTLSLLDQIKEKGFHYKKKKGGDPILDIVAYTHVITVDHDEIMEIQRAAKLNSALGAKVNYVDPEAEERFKLWKTLFQNQVLSFFYYDFAI